VPPDPACTYAWSVNPTSRGIITGGQGTATINILWSSFGPATLGVTATNGTTTCVKSGTHLLEVHPKPIPVFTPHFDLITTTQAKKFILRKADPWLSGQGVFSGNRVSLNTMTGKYEFDPFGASAGLYLITYTFTNNYGCYSSSIPITLTIRNQSFTCGEDYTDPRDNQIYRTGLLGGKCWFLENLNYGNTTGTPAPPQTDNGISEKYCSPDDLQCNLYGGFYQWDEVMQYGDYPDNKGICPPEWHVPSESEWQQLIDNLVAGILPPAANALAGGTMKDPLIINGFDALLGGVFYNNFSWSFISGSNTGSLYWTSTPYGSNQAIARGLNVHTPSVSRYAGSRGNAFPVRCIRD
jgi:uncharacterized protein (TIGR02145 family)